MRHGTGDFDLLVSLLCTPGLREAMLTQEWIHNLADLVERCMFVVSIPERHGFGFQDLHALSLELGHRSDV